MGAPAPLPTIVNQTSFEYTSTRSTFIMDVGGLVTMNITFLSPVNPTDLMRQSLPFSYLDVVVSSADGALHDVQLYTDITAGQSQPKALDHFSGPLTSLFIEWVSADRTAVAEWQYGVTANGSTEVAYHQFHRQRQLLWSETFGMYYLQLWLPTKTISSAGKMAEE